jgi:ubiquitin C-terminal hydrolase
MYYSPNYINFALNSGVTTTNTSNQTGNNYDVYNLFYHNNTHINSNYLDNNLISNKGEIKNTNYSHNSMIEEKKIINNKTIETTNAFKKPCGIINYGNNCYLNSGLQILATCEKFVKELEKYKSKNKIKPQLSIINHCCQLIDLINDAFYKLLNEEQYDPKQFLQYFCSMNNTSFSSQYCSQDFIRTLLNNLNKVLNKIGDIHHINEYKQYIPQSEAENQQFLNFINSNNLFPESMALKLFSGLTKSHSFGKCKYCKESIEDFSFCYFIDQNIYLDNIYDGCNFKSVLSKNLRNDINLTMNCPKCGKEINIKEEIKIIKLPEILIFTLERYNGGFNNISIEPDDIIDMKEYLDTSLKLENTKYSLFAINIRLGKLKDFGHEICQVKRGGQWYEINDIYANKRTKEYKRNSYGLFYKRL